MADLWTSIWLDAEAGRPWCAGRKRHSGRCPAAVMAGRCGNSATSSECEDTGLSRGYFSLRDCLEVSGRWWVQLPDERDEALVGGGVGAVGVAESGRKRGFLDAHAMHQAEERKQDHGRHAKPIG